MVAKPENGKVDRSNSARHLENSIYQLSNDELSHLHSTQQALEDFFELVQYENIVDSITKQGNKLESAELAVSNQIAVGMLESLHTSPTFASLPLFHRLTSFIRDRSPSTESSSVPTVNDGSVPDFKLHRLDGARWKPGIAGTMATAATAEFDFKAARADFQPVTKMSYQSSSGDFALFTGIGTKNDPVPQPHVIVLIGDAVTSPYHANSDLYLSNLVRQTALKELLIPASNLVHFASTKHALGLPTGAITELVNHYHQTLVNISKKDGIQGMAGFILAACNQREVVGVRAADLGAAIVYDTHTDSGIHALTIPTNINQTIDKPIVQASQLVNNRLLHPIERNAHQHTRDLGWQSTIQKGDKYNKGQGSVSVLGLWDRDPGDSLEFFQLEVPKDAKNAVLVTWTDGLESLANAIGISPPLAALYLREIQTSLPHQEFQKSLALLLYYTIAFNLSGYDQTQQVRAKCFDDLTTTSIQLKGRNIELPKVATEEDFISTEMLNDSPLGQYFRNMIKQNLDLILNRKQMFDYI